jgi:Protein of unknown function (DUF1553)/Protein of unknown function (DUF1549)
MLRSGLLLFVVAAPFVLVHPTARASPTTRDAHALSEQIDEVIAARWAKEGVKSAHPADDAEFFRRLSLDLNGRIPTVTQLRDFLDDTRPDKRRLWVEELIEGRDNATLYVNHFTNVWQRLFLSHITDPWPSARVGLDEWLHEQIKVNAPYDRLVRGLLTDPDARAFLRANEYKPENLAGNATRLFLGVKIECAQCHDHPSAKWKREQFWGMAAFFTGLQRSSQQEPGASKIKIGESSNWVEARFLDGNKPQWKKGAKPREVLAEWMVRADNPWFVRAAVNRVWHYFFGVGLVDPVDGLGSNDVVPSHPELLEELAKEFAVHDFDLKYLIRAITGSKTYALTSRLTDPSQKDARLFARARVRGLSPEQLLESLTLATGYRPVQSSRLDEAPFGPGSPQAQFLAKFDDDLESPADVKTSIPQALFMMNGSLTEEATKPERSQTLTAVLAGKSRPTLKCIEELYLATLSRKPRAEEARRLVKYVEEGGRQERLRDVLWALVNSTEFVLNH